MGTLRLLLAIAVIVAHITPGFVPVGTGGETSVQCFYMISGFFISMILDQKYNKPGDLKIFYSNRFLRIFSVYWFFLIISVILSIGAHFLTGHGSVTLWVENWRKLGPLGLVFLLLSNIFLLGQDWTLYLRLGAQGLHWTTHFQDFHPLVTNFLFLPPAWSLGIELSFYAVAPFLTRLRTSTLALLIVASLAVRLIFQQNGLGHDPWSYRFFPFELALFLAGALAYRIFRRTRPMRLTLPWKLFAFASFPLLLAFPAYDHSNGLFFSTGRLCLYAYLICAIPLLFRLTGKVPWDRALGELSFPLYLCHPIVLSFMTHTMRFFPHLWMRIVFGVGVSVVAAWLTVLYLDKPINRLRQMRLARNHRQPQAPTKPEASHLPLSSSPSGEAQTLPG